jgi:hypothetical protein
MDVGCFRSLVSGIRYCGQFKVMRKCGCYGWTRTLTLSPVVRVSYCWNFCLVPVLSSTHLGRSLSAHWAHSRRLGNFNKNHNTPMPSSIRCRPPCLHAANYASNSSIYAAGHGPIPSPNHLPFSPSAYLSPTSSTVPSYTP